MNDVNLSSLLGVLREAEKKTIHRINLKAWRVTLSQTSKINLGVKNNIVGSVYTPPSYSSRESGEVFLIWEDGRCSRSRIQSVSGSREEYWTEQLSLWRQASYEDHHGVYIPAPADLPKVILAQDDIFNIITSDSSYMFDQQQEIISKRPADALTNADMFAMWTRNIINTSTGIAADYPESRFAVSWSFDSQISQGFAERRLPSSEEWEVLWRESVTRYELLQISANPVNKNTVVILAPEVAQQMVEQFILSSFRGENVLEHHSRFAAEDFYEKKQYFDERLTLEIDPLQSFGWSSYILTAEGVPAARTTIVDKGCLNTPYLNTKDAKRWQAAPTAIPIGARGITIKHSNEALWQEKIKQIQDGVLVMSVLGLHTQNPVAGRYSLTAPSSLRIENGTLTGKTDIRINGNIWDVLKSKDTMYLNSSNHSYPYIVTRSSSEPL